MKKLLSIIFFSCFIFSLQARIVVTNGLSHQHDLSNLDNDRGVIRLKNMGKEEQRVRIYLSDLFMDCDKGTTFVSAGEALRSNADWITISSVEEVVSPDESVEIQYVIKKPSSVAQNGSFWSFIMVENVPEIDTSNVEGGVKLNTNFRYAVQIISDIGGEDGDIGFDSVYYAPESSELVLHMTNPSTRLIRATFELEMFNSKGEQLKFQGDTPVKLYPGLCRKVKLPLDAEERTGLFEGNVIVRTNNFGLFGYRLKMDLDE